MASDRNMDRRGFIRATAAALAAAPYGVKSLGAVSPEAASCVLRVHSSQATREWDYSANEPWDHTVEPRDGQPGKIEERYFDYINEDVVERMLAAGMRSLTGEADTGAAWRRILPDARKGQKVTVKCNMNNASFDPEVTTNRMDQTMPLVNAVVGQVCEATGIPEQDITLLDASRWFHPVIMKGRCRYAGVRWVDSRTRDRWDRSESVRFTKDRPLPGGDFWMPRDYTGADHIINLCIMKNHGCGITGAMKSHFGSIPSPKKLHEGLGDRSYIADLCNTPSIRDKVRINIADALFANWHNNVWCPRPWITFPEPSPNSLLLSTDPVAIDSVMLDHITDEVHAQGDNAPRWVRDCLNHHAFLEYAMKEHGLGVFEHKPYRRIDYRLLEV